MTATTEEVARLIGRASRVAAIYGAVVTALTIPLCIITILIVLREPAGNVVVYLLANQRTWNQQDDATLALCAILLTLPGLLLLLSSYLIRRTHRWAFLVACGACAVEVVQAIAACFIFNTGRTPGMQLESMLVGIVFMKFAAGYVGYRILKALPHIRYAAENSIMRRSPHGFDLESNPGPDPAILRQAPPPPRRDA